jgi:hypothetical protein
MSQLQQLLESAAGSWKNLQSDAAKLAKKWDKTGLLEGLGEIERNHMSMLLENQAKQLVVESSLTGGGTAGATFTVGVGEQWAGVALPMVRKIFGQIVAKEFLSLQTMNMPSGLVFFLDFQYGTQKSPFVTGSATDVYSTSSLYGLTEGASAPSQGLYGAGRFSYSINNTSSALTPAAAVTASWADFNYDANYSASAVPGSGTYTKLNIDLSGKYADLKGCRAFTVSGSKGTNS